MDYIIETTHKILSALYINNIIDILLISLCVYVILIFIKQTRSFFILSAFIILFGLNFISEKFDLTLTRQLFQPLLTFFIAVFVIVFQPEIRKFFKWISSGRPVSFKKALALPENNIQTIVRSVFEMAKKKVGAILVIPGEYPLDDLLEGGFPLNGKISLPLILSIFNSSTPGHDGAILIEGSEVKMFGLHLPLAREFNEYGRVGTRHRAGAGITEKTDALSIIVSEERGEVSISLKGKLQKVKTPEELADIIAKFTNEHIDSSENTKNKNTLNYFIFRNGIYKVLSVFISITLWFFVVYQEGVIKLNFAIPIEYRSINNNLTIKSSYPETIDVTITGKNRDVSGLKSNDIKIVLDGTSIKSGENILSIKQDNIQIPSYVKLGNFTPKSIKVITVNKSDI